MSVIYILVLYPAIDLIGAMIFVGMAGIVPVAGALVLSPVMATCHPFAVSVAITFGGIGTVIANLLLSLSVFVWNSDALAGLAVFGFPVLGIPSFGLGVFLASVIIVLATLRR